MFSTAEYVLICVLTVILALIFVVLVMATPAAAECISSSICDDFGCTTFTECF